MDLPTKITQFGTLAAELRGKPQFQRLSLFVQEKTGKRLQEFLTGPAPESEKHDLIDEVTRIVTEKDWDKLPEAPSGQTEAAPSPSPATPPPTVKLKPAAPVATPAPVDTSADDVIDDPDEAIAKAEAALAAAKAAAQAKRTPGITADQVRELVKSELPAMVRVELKAVLQGLADAL